MARLTKIAESKIITLLVSEGLADKNLVSSAQNEMANSDDSVLTELKKRGVISDDMVSRATAAIINVPYVELRNITIDQDILSIIPYEAQVRVLAVPLGEKDGLLNVAMTDVTNVQAVDYISNLLSRPIRVRMSS